jgi:hypothetical protein
MSTWGIMMYHHKQLEMPIGWRTEDRDRGIGWDVKDPVKAP